MHSFSFIVETGVPSRRFCCEMNAGRSRLQRREGNRNRERRREEVEASRGVIGGGYRRQGVGGNEGGWDRNQTSRHRVEGVDGEGSTPVRANDSCAFVYGFTWSCGETCGKDETKGQKGIEAGELKRKEELKDETEKDGA